VITPRIGEATLRVVVADFGAHFCSSLTHHTDQLNADKDYATTGYCLEQKLDRARLLTHDNLLDAVIK
jgi:hypothetical protein